MNFETTLLFLGVALLLVGLLGKIEIKEAVLGTSSTAARIVCGLLGVCLLGLALHERFPAAAGTAPSSNFSSTPAGMLDGPLSTAENASRPSAAAYVVISSTKSLEEARFRASRLESKSYSVGVYSSTTGFMAVAVQADSTAQAEQIRRDLIAKGLATEDSYVSVGRGFTRRVPGDNTGGALSR